MSFSDVKTVSDTQTINTLKIVVGSKKGKK